MTDEVIVGNDGALAMHVESQLAAALVQVAFTTGVSGAVDEEFGGRAGGCRLVSKRDVARHDGG